MVTKTRVKSYESAQDILFFYKIDLISSFKHLLQRGYSLYSGTGVVHSNQNTTRALQTSSEETAHVGNTTLFALDLV